VAGHVSSSSVAVLLRVLGIATAGLAACWPLASPGSAAPASLMAVAAIALASAAVVLLCHSGCLATLAAGPLLRRAVALRRKSWGAAFQRQRDPDAAGHARPRAPSAVPAAA
jgi:Family of unknown function (DUF6412)